jgi:hypothetical protein
MIIRVILFLLMMVMVTLFGCNDINMDCGNPVLTKECKAIYKDCNAAGWDVDPRSTSPKFNPSSRNACFETNYMPKCRECKLIK